MGNKEKAAGSVAIFNHTDISRSDAEKIQCWCRLTRAAAAEKFSMLLVSVLFTEHLPLFLVQFLSATSNIMAGGKLQLRDAKRFEQPQLASS